MKMKKRTAVKIIHAIDACLRAGDYLAFAVLGFSAGVYLCVRVYCGG